MSRAVSIDALGIVIRIDCSSLSDEGWDAVRSVWRDAAHEPADALAPAASVVADGGVPVPSMLTALSTEVTLAAIEHRAGEVLMLHAAGLATRDGRVVALVGPSGRGKTTASQVLGRELGYVSDETVAITADGAVLPYRKPLSLIEGDVLPKVQRSPTEMNLRPLPRTPLRLAALVLIERTDDDAPASSQRMEAGEAIAGLAQQASYLGRMTSPLHVIAAHVEAVGGVHRVSYRDAAALLPLIRDLVEREPHIPRRRPNFQVDDSPAESGSSPPVAHERWQRVATLDSLRLDDGRLVLLVRDTEHASRVVVLDGIGPALWLSSAQPASLATLVQSTVAAYGQPADGNAESVVAASVADLEGAGLLIHL